MSGEEKRLFCHCWLHVAFTVSLQRKCTICRKTAGVGSSHVICPMG